MFGVSRILCLVAALMFAPFSLAAPLVPVKDFARSHAVINAKISPNGDYLAVSKWFGDQMAVGIIDLKSMKLTGALQFTQGDSPANFWWVGPKRVVASVAKQYGFLDQPYLTGELFAIDADGGNRSYLFGYRGADEIGSRLHQSKKDFAYGFMVDPLVRDPDSALISVWSTNKNIDRTFPFIEKVDVYSGTRHRVGVVPAYDAEVIADDEGQPRFAAGYDEDAQPQMLFYSKGDKDWTKLDSAGATPQEIQLHRMGRKNTSAYLSFSERGAPSCLREFRFKDHALSTLSCNGTVDADDVQFSLDGDHPVAITFEDGKPQTFFPDPEEADARLLRSLQKSFEGQRLSITSHTEDGKQLVLLVNGDRNPGDFYLVDRATMNARYLVSRRSWIDPATMQRVEPVQVRTRDGATIYGYLTASAGLKTKNAPLVLMPHGGPYGIRDFWEWNADAQLLASRGYTVLQVNYRGSGGYGDDYRKAGYRKWSSLMQDDLTDSVKWAITQGIADPARVCIYGASYGGYAALMSATKEPDLYQCAAALAGVYDLVTQSEDSDVADSWLGRTYFQRNVGDDKKELAAQSPVTYIAKLKAAVLIAHGISDRRVPFSQAKELRKALEKNGKPYDWMEFAGEEHGLSKEENQVAFYNKLLEFLDKHIGSSAPAAPAVSSAASP
jgi:dipeptidyl aminopeptidase/acylaminoacyl peptidase